MRFILREKRFVSFVVERFWWTDQHSFGPVGDHSSYEHKLFIPVRFHESPDVWKLTIHICVVGFSERCFNRPQGDQSFNGLQVEARRLRCNHLLTLLLSFEIRLKPYFEECRENIIGDSLVASLNLLIDLVLKKIRLMSVPPFR